MKKKRKEKKRKIFMFLLQGQPERSLANAAR
jgi:hypothetical protein